jgi:hypothetical protein
MLKSRTLALALACLAAGCASSRNKALDERLAQEPAQTRKALQAEADQKVAEDSSLSADQKKQLAILRSSVSKQLDDLSAQSLKLRSVLVEELLSPTYSLDEVNLIKGRLKKVEDQRLSVMFDGIDKANSILGRQAPQNRRMMRALLEDRSNARD